MSHEVVKWTDTPDLWELRLSWQSPTNQQYQDFPNTPFTLEELHLISAQLTAMREFMHKAHELTAEQGSKIDTKFDEMEKAARRLGRKDWTAIFLGGVFALILADAITPDIAQHLLTIVMHGLEHLSTAGPRSIGAQ